MVQLVLAVRMVVQTLVDTMDIGADMAVDPDTVAVVGDMVVVVVADKCDEVIVTS
jgi:hypothetical protein